MPVETLSLGRSMKQESRDFSHDRFNCIVDSVQQDRKENLYPMGYNLCANQTNYTQSGIERIMRVFEKHSNIHYALV